MADFIVEFTPRHPKVLWVGGSKQENPKWDATWQVYVDRASNCRGVGVGTVPISLKDVRLEKSFRLGFQASTNETEYEALLRMSKQVGAVKMQFHCDSRLIVS